jgi:hypothetical protein
VRFAITDTEELARIEANESLMQVALCFTALVAGIILGFMMRDKANGKKFNFKPFSIFAIGGLLGLVAFYINKNKDQNKPNHVTAEQIIDPAAPTVGLLKRRGLVRIDDEPAGWSGPNGEIIDGFSAIYMGKNVASPTENDRQFICPSSDQEMDNWKCQAWGVSNNG